jgi:hypothetical protein
MSYAGWLQWSGGEPAMKQVRYSVVIAHPHDMPKAMQTLHTGPATCINPAVQNEQCIDASEASQMQQAVAHMIQAGNTTHEFRTTALLYTLASV